MQKYGSIENLLWNLKGICQLFEIYRGISKKKTQMIMYYHECRSGVISLLTNGGHGAKMTPSH